MSSPLPEAAPLDFRAHRVAPPLQQAKALVQKQLSSHRTTVALEERTTLAESITRKADADSLATSTASGEDLREASMTLMPRRRTEGI